jgi:glyoxylase-like metal-dependent hydrolase (beta-lactamase superfamily II)
MPAVQEIARGCHYVPAFMSNAYLLAEGSGWFLVDAGTPGSAGRIRWAVSETFGRGRPPEAIILAHRYFDHVGALCKLAAEWDVPVCAHRLELPYLQGQSFYPPPDPTVGGFMSQLSRMFPNGPSTPADGFGRFLRKASPGWDGK